MTVTSPGAVVPRRRLLDLYAATSLATRAHVRVRWATCPLPAVAAALPAAGRVLEVGCGHGLVTLYVALRSPGLAVRGVDIDSDKIDDARAAARQLPPIVDVGFEVSPSGRVPDGPWDGIAIVDVLYLLPAAAQRALLADCAGRLAPGGVLAVKEMSPVPRWKARWNRAQETLSVRLLRITAHAAAPQLTFLAPEEMAAPLREAGLEVEQRRLDRGYVHPHHLLLARRPAPRRA